MTLILSNLTQGEVQMLHHIIGLQKENLLEIYEELGVNNYKHDELIEAAGCTKQELIETLNNQYLDYELMIDNPKNVFTFPEYRLDKLEFIVTKMVPLLELPDRESANSITKKFRLWREILNKNLWNVN